MAQDRVSQARSNHCFFNSFSGTSAARTAAPISLAGNSAQDSDRNRWK